MIKNGMDNIQSHPPKPHWSGNWNKIPDRIFIYYGADYGIKEFKRSYIKHLFSWFERFLKNGEKSPNLDFDIK